MSVIYKASIKCRSISVYPYFYEKKKYANAVAPPLVTTRDVQNVQSSRSRMRLRTALDLLIYTAKEKKVWVKKTQTFFKYKINFVTLTLPSKQIHSDKEIVKNIFSPFMEAWSKRRAGLLYVYKAEVQDNGNIHFHVVTNAFIHYIELRKKWNKACEKLGYVTRSKSDEPNSTDVHAIGNKGDVAAYLSSYMSKKDIYSKALKKWHKKYKEVLQNKSRNITILPRKYFKNIKRKVGVSYWSCSKILKGFKAISECDYGTVSWRMLAMLREIGGFRKFDFCEQLYYEINGFEMFPEFKKIVDDTLSLVHKAQSLNVISESIEAL